MIYQRLSFSEKNIDNRRMVDITRDKPIRVAVRVVVPVRDHPKVRLLILEKVILQKNKMQI